MRRYTYEPGRRPLSGYYREVYQLCLDFEMARLRLPTADDVSAAFGWKSRDAGAGALNALVGRGWLTKTIERGRAVYHIKRDGDE